MSNKFHQGFYIPKNVEKYVGKEREIVYRSSWELKLFLWCDQNPSILQWSSETVIIPYVNPFDGRIHRYYMDLIIQVKTKSGGTNTVLIEVKPSDQTIPPKKSSKNTKQYQQKVKNYLINLAKWQAAERFAKENGMKFLIITEKNLKNLQ